MAAKKSPAAGKPPTPRAVSVPLSPPSYVVRQQAGLALPNGRQLFEALFGVLGGAVVSAVFITVMPGESKWVGAFLTGALGGVLAATSPIGTFAEEIGMGALAASGSWMYFDVTGQVAQPIPQAGAVRLPAPPS